MVKTSVGDQARTDPYVYCESGGCSHDVARGVLLDELWHKDGPYRTTAASGPTILPDPTIPHGWQHVAIEEVPGA